MLVKIQRCSTSFGKGLTSHLKWLSYSFPRRHPWIRPKKRQTSVLLLLWVPLSVASVAWLWCVNCFLRLVSKLNLPQQPPPTKSNQQPCCMLPFPGKDELWRATQRLRASMLCQETVQFLLKSAFSQTSEVKKSSQPPCFTVGHHLAYHICITHCRVTTILLPLTPVLPKHTT